MTPQSRRRLLINAAFVFTAAFIFWAVNPYRKSKDKSEKDTYVAQGDSLHPFRILVALSPEDFGIKESGKVGGLQVKLAEKLFEGLSIRWIPVMNQQEAYKQLLAGEADIYAGSFPLSRKKDLEAHGLYVSQPVFNNSLVLIGQASEANPMDLNMPDSSYHVAVSSDKIGAQIVLSNIIELAYPNMVADIEKSNELTLALDVVKGVHKYAVINRELATEMVNRYPEDIKIIQDISFNTQQVWLVQPGDSTVLRLLNDKITDNLGRK